MIRFANHSTGSDTPKFIHGIPVVSVVTIFPEPFLLKVFLTPGVLPGFLQQNRPGIPSGGPRVIHGFAKRALQWRSSVHSSCNLDNLAHGPMLGAWWLLGLLAALKTGWNQKTMVGILVVKSQIFFWATSWRRGFYHQRPVDADDCNVYPLVMTNSLL